MERKRPKAKTVLAVIAPLGSREKRVATHRTAEPAKGPAADKEFDRKLAKRLAG